MIVHVEYTKDEQLGSKYMGHPMIKIWLEKNAQMDAAQLKLAAIGSKLTPMINAFAASLGKKK